MSDIDYCAPCFVFYRKTFKLLEEEIALSF